MYEDVMIDLETLGTRPGCEILSIGAVAFNRESLGSEFYTTIDCTGLNLHQDEYTKRWWDEQSPEARQLLEQPRTPYEEALMNFELFLLQFPRRFRVWGNGADFDLPILAAVFHAAQRPLPWSSFSGRCYRTLKNFYPSLKLKRIGTFHNALDDAKSQALHQIELLKALNLPL